MRMAYLCNSFPEPSESYVIDEIRELTAKGAVVIAGGVRKGKDAPCADTGLRPFSLFPLNVKLCMAATWLLVRRIRVLSGILRRALRGPEPVSNRFRAVAHTWLGAYFAAFIRTATPDHVHVHHGYFASWVAMTAARLLGIEFSMTLHGSDLLVRADYLDLKLQECRFCFTVSDFNRRYILDRYPRVAPEKVSVQRLGVDVEFWRPRKAESRGSKFQMLCVGRLHPVKNHSFLLLACRAMKSAGGAVSCIIAGEGEERPKLQALISQFGLHEEVQLLGQVARRNLLALYARADAVVLTSHSEGIPLTLMEAMAMERIVIAPEITGIPELVLPGKTGFLYRPGSMQDFLAQLQVVIDGRHLLDNVRRGAREHVIRRYNNRINLPRFANTFLALAEASQPGTLSRPIHENPVLQQV